MHFIRIRLYKLRTLWLGTEFFPGLHLLETRDKNLGPFMVSVRYTAAGNGPDNDASRLPRHQNAAKWCNLLRCKEQSAVARKWPKGKKQKQKATSLF